MLEKLEKYRHLTKPMFIYAACSFAIGAFMLIIGSFSGNVNSQKNQKKLNGKSIQFNQTIVSHVKDNKVINLDGQGDLSKQSALPPPKEPAPNATSHAVQSVHLKNFANARWMKPDKNIPIFMSKNDSLIRFYGKFKAPDDSMCLISFSNNVSNTDNNVEIYDDAFSLLYSVDKKEQNDKFILDTYFDSETEKGALFKKVIEMDVQKGREYYVFIQQERIFKNADGNRNEIKGYIGVSFRKPIPSTFQEPEEIQFDSSKQCLEINLVTAPGKSSKIYKLEASQTDKYLSDVYCNEKVEQTFYDSNKNKIQPEIDTNFMSRIQRQLNFEGKKKYFMEISTESKKRQLVRIVLTKPRIMPLIGVVHFGNIDDYNIFQLFEKSNLKEFVLTAPPFFPISIVNEASIEEIGIKDIAIQDQGDLDKIKKEYRNRMNEFQLPKENLLGDVFLNQLKTRGIGLNPGIGKQIAANTPIYTMDNYQRDLLQTAVRLLRADSRLKLWLSIPKIEYHILARKYLPIFHTFMEQCKANLDKENPNYWKNNIAGFYFDTEEIPQWYTSFENEDMMQNPMVFTMDDLSKTIHQQYQKKFLWIPYLGDQDTSLENCRRIGYVANTTSIFDYVILQPSFLYHPEWGDNLNYVKESVAKNQMCYPFGIPVVPKSALTVIGPEMEFDPTADSVDTFNPARKDKNYIGDFQKYVQAYKEFLPTRPFAFYKVSYFEDEARENTNGFNFYQNIGTNIKPLITSIQNSYKRLD